MDLCPLSTDSNGRQVEVRIIIGKTSYLISLFSLSISENIRLNVGGSVLLLDSKQLIKMDDVVRNLDWACISLACPSSYGPEWKNEKGS